MLFQQAKEGRRHSHRQRPRRPLRPRATKAIMRLPQHLIPTLSIPAMIICNKRRMLPTPLPHILALSVADAPSCHPPLLAPRRQPPPHPGLLLRRLSQCPSLILVRYSAAVTAIFKLNANAARVTQHLGGIHVDSELLRLSQAVCVSFVKNCSFGRAMAIAMIFFFFR